MKSRNKTTSSSSMMAKPSSSSFGSSSTTAAAVSVTKFGQATFTSVRHRKQDHNENGNFIPLKKTKYEHHDPMDDLMMMKMENKSMITNLNNNNNITTISTSSENKISETKPKVYKFFKSRSSSNNNNNSNTLSNITSSLITGQQSHNSRSSSSSSTTNKPSIVLNNFTNQKQQRITTTTCNIKTNSNNNNNNNNIKNNNQTIQTKSINLNDKSCEIKICGDKTIKKIISPNKITEFHIRNNNTNVRNATIKPSIQQTKIHQTLLPSEAKRGLRSSRRLKGYEPDMNQSNNEYNEQQQLSPSIHFVYEKKSTTTTNKLTTTIDEVIDDDDNEIKQDDVDEIKKDDVEQQQQQEIKQNETNENNHSDIVNENGENNNSEIIENTSEATTTTIDISNNEYTQVKELNNNDNNLKDLKDETKNNDENNKESLNKNNNEIVNENKIENEKPEQQQQQQIPQPQPQQIIRPPKKKIFSNREHRNKIEFDAKNFFSSELNDEIDDELNKQLSSSSSTSTIMDNDKKSNNNDNDDNNNNNNNDYIKLKRVKKAHQCHELGETEQFDEDIKYYLSGILSSNPNSMRCLSILGLTQQTMTPEFRMHLRAHDDMPRIIKALMDAPQDSNLALCTACLMFVYNQDRLTMDIDPNALSLMLELLETRSDECNQVEEKHRLKIRSLVEEMKNKGHAQYLKLNEITAGKLAMETLLGLTSKRAGDWFKVELRRMKGIDFIVNTVIRCAEKHNEEGQIVKIDRCMHVLENVTFNNVENQLYIVNYDESKFISTCITLLIECKNYIIRTNESKVYLSAFFSILRVLTNLTSESVDGCKIVGKFNGIIELLLESLFELPSFIMSDQRFDLMVIIICLCINLSAFCEHIRFIIMMSETKNYLQKLCDLLFKKIEEAEQVEKQTDHLLESHESVQMTEAMQDNLLMQMISKSGTHMEHSLLSACVCLLLGCCIQDNDEYRKLLYNTLPNNSFKPLIEQLKKLRDFAHLADIMTQKGKERVQKVLQLFESCNNNVENIDNNNNNNNNNQSLIDDDDDDFIDSVPDDDDYDDNEEDNDNVNDQNN